MAEKGNEMDSASH